MAVGLLPSAATIGVAAPILLVLLRAFQGLAVGGEWAGAALFAAESAPAHRRGRFGAFPQLGTTVAFVLASLTFLIIYSIVGKADGVFLEWGWRVPFLLSGVLIALGCGCGCARLRRRSSLQPPALSVDPRFPSRMSGAASPGPCC